MNLIQHIRDRIALWGEIRRFQVMCRHEYDLKRLEQLLTEAEKAAEAGLPGGQTKLRIAADAIFMRFSNNEQATVLKMMRQLARER